MKTATQSMINGDQRLVSATFSGGRLELKTYDDGFGPLWIHRDSMGISGIVRAQTWEDAYSICEDEFFPDGDDEANEEMAAIESMPDGDNREHAQACWDEAYGFRGNARRTKGGKASHIYSKDLNGDRLDLLTPELVAALGISLKIESWE